MSDLLIRDVDSDLKSLLADQARKNRRSLSEEARAVLRRGLAQAPQQMLLGERIRNLIPEEYRTELDITRDLHDRPLPDFR